ncbi:MAG: hypothetical protein JEZ06_08015 [Anaerolineaceae bacterium]|nr:hypothetical protein [Anaerolineaceae bacterium]
MTSAAQMMLSVQDQPISHIKILLKTFQKEQYDYILFDTSPTGEVQLSQRFTPFGEVKEKYGEVEASFGYAAQKYDAQTGLLYLRARYYAPGTLISAGRQVYFA